MICNSGSSSIRGSGRRSGIQGGQVIEVIRKKTLIIVIIVVKFVLWGGSGRRRKGLS